MVRPHFSGKAARALEMAIHRGLACIRQRGAELSKEPCLCHGAAGNALTLPQQEMEDWMEQYAAEETIDNSAEQLELSSARASLWSGMAGRLWCWFVVLVLVRC